MYKPHFKLHLAVLAVFMLLLAACEPVTDVTPKVKLASADDIVPEADFNAWRTNWASIGADYSSRHLPNNFVMPLVDLTEVLGEEPAASRFYLGLEINAGDSTMHLMVVGTDSLGIDILDYNNGKYAYDVTCPCPNICVGPGVNVITCKSKN